MVRIDYGGDGVGLLHPETPIQALLLAEAHVRAIGCPQLSPLDMISAVNRGVLGGEVVAGIFTGSKLTLKELLPGLKLRVGSSEIEVVRVRPTENEVTYKTRGHLIKMDSNKFLQLATQQRFRKTWDLQSFLVRLKDILKPVLAAVPLMWVLKLVTNAVRKKPLFTSNVQRKEGGNLSSFL